MRSGWCGVSPNGRLIDEGRAYAVGHLVLGVGDAGRELMLREAGDHGEFLPRSVQSRAANLPVQRGRAVGLAFQTNGRMFWFIRKKFFGSYFVFSCRRRW
jgi:hypothetical protein